MSKTLSQIPSFQTDALFERQRVRPIWNPAVLAEGSGVPARASAPLQLGWNDDI